MLVFIITQFLNYLLITEGTWYIYIGEIWQHHFKQLIKLEITKFDKLTTYVSWKDTPAKNI